MEATVSADRSSEIFHRTIRFYRGFQWEGSREVDLAIFDEQYTQYIFRYENMKYIPIEVVVVMVQYKSKGLKAASLADWT